MTDVEQSLTLSEWTQATPDTHAQLAGLSLNGNPVHRLQLRQWQASDRLEILELVNGLAINTFACVGSVKIGPLHLTILPKLTGLPLLHLLRYAYNLRHLDLFAPLAYTTASHTFQDLLIQQLAAETAELLSRGLHRQYHRLDQALTSPRGRIDFQQLARQGGPAQAALPCTYYPRQQNYLLNGVLLAGVQLAVSLTTDLTLRTELRRLSALMQETIVPAPFNRPTLQQVHRAMNRLTRAYTAAITLIEILLESAGISLDDPPPHTPRLPGFLFDMNRFFQTLLARFLRENLPGYDLREEFRLVGMMRYLPDYNPRGIQAPTPRPDFIVLRQGQITGVLDAKYRDLWVTSLPREMLYQLTIYAMSQATTRQAVILYPTLIAAAQEARIEIREPLYGSRQAQVILRPVNLTRLAELVSPTNSRLTEQARHQFAAQMVAIG